MKPTEAENCAGASKDVKDGQFREGGKLLPISAAPDALAERIKELNCLYGISNLFENQDVTLDWILTRAVEMIPAALQYPELACACIKLDGHEYISAGFQHTRWCRNKQIILNGRHVGDLTVCYTQAMVSGDSSLFLEEESHLLQTICERLSKVLWLKLSEEALKESEERYRVVTEQVTDGVVLVQEARFCYVNPAFCKMFNVSSVQDMINSPVHNPAAGGAEDIMQMYRGYIDQGIEDKADHVHRLSRPGKTMWIQVCHSPITYKGQPALLSTFKDGHNQDPGPHYGYSHGI